MSKSDVGIVPGCKEDEFLEVVFTQEFTNWWQLLPESLGIFEEIDDRQDIVTFFIEGMEFLQDMMLNNMYSAFELTIEL